MSKTTFTQQYEDAMKKFGGKGTSAAATAAARTQQSQAAKPKKPEPMFKEVTTSTPEDWKTFSEVFGFAPPSGNDRAGPVYHDHEWDAAVAAFVPAKQPGYYMPERETEALWHAHIDNDVVWLHGQSGTGKSSLEEQFAAHIGQPFLRFNGREDIESSALFGQLTVEEGEFGGTVWKDGLLTEAVKHGARCLMDEATLIPAGIWMGVQWLLEKDGKLMLTDKPAAAGDRLVTPAPQFRLTFADNTRGQGDENGSFNGTGVMNTATLNRVGVTLEIDYLPESKELKVLESQFGDRINRRVLKDVVSVATMLRKALREGEVSLAFSLRSIGSVLRKAYNYRTLPVGQALRRGFDEGYANLLPNADEQGAAVNLWNMVFDKY